MKFEDGNTVAFRPSALRSSSSETRKVKQIRNISNSNSNYTKPKAKEDKSSSSSSNERGLDYKDGIKFFLFKNLDLRHQEEYEYDFALFVFFLLILSVMPLLLTIISSLPLSPRRHRFAFVTLFADSLQLPSKTT